MSHLGNFFRDRRIEKGLAFGRLARLLGYKNVSGGSNRIQAFERGGKVRPDFLGKLAEVLEVSPDQIRLHAGEDYEEWLAWASEPVRPHLVVRLLAAVYQRAELPDDALAPEAAGAFASDVARERKLRVCLVLSRRVSIWFDSEGRESGRSEATPDMPCEPFLIIGGKRVQFHFGDGMGLRPIDGPGH